MEPEANQRRSWDIDKQLEALVGCAVRVRAEVVKPKRSNGELSKHGIDAKNLILADGTLIDGEPIFVEGIVKGFERRVSVVYIDLERLALQGAGEGRVAFRGASAIIMRGPAVVQMAHPYFVERIPTEEKAYWKHLCSIDGQFDLGLG